MSGRRWMASGASGIIAGRMRALGLVFAVTTLASVVVGATPASASARWVADPGGASWAVGSTGIGIITVQSAGWGEPELLCETVPTPIYTFSSPDSYVGQVEDVLLDECAGAFGMILSVESSFLPWSLHALDYSAPVMSGEIRDVSATYVGVNCWAEAEGFLPVTYDNETAVLTLIPDFTLEVTFVDPGNDCNGLFSVGDLVAYDAKYNVTPGQEIVLA